MTRISLVSIIIGYGLDDRSSISGKDTTSQPILRLTEPLIQLWYRDALSSGVK